MNIGTTINKRETVAAGFASGPLKHEQPSNATVDSEGQISFSSELIRKSIHLGSLTIPIAYYYVNRSVAIPILVVLTLLSMFVDVGRFYIPALHRFVERMFDRILRPHERHAGLLSGATYVLVSALFCVAIFPKLITVTAFSILILSDSSSALFGRAFGKHKFLDKSLEGTIAFILTAWVVVFLTPKAGPLAIEYVIGAVAAIVGGIAEAASVSLRLDDNLSVPISIGFAMWGLYWLMSVIDPATYGALYQSLLHLS